jgi:asparagine synthase (glutamine-hydrolysing)
MWARLRKLIPLHRKAPPVVNAVIADLLTYLDADALTDLHETALAAEAAGRQGLIVEAGCALGGSAIVLATAKAPNRPMRVYDVFGMIPPPSDADDQDVHERYEVIRSGQSEGLGGERYYGYEDDLLAKVAANFDAHGVPLEANRVELVQGLFEDTLILDEPVCIAHIDGDWYESVSTCLERIHPVLVPGGVMIIDDYFAWSGARKAVDDFLARHGSAYRTVRKERLHLVRI